MHIGTDWLTFNEAKQYCIDYGSQLYTLSNSTKADALKAVTATWNGRFWFNAHNPDFSLTEIKDLDGNVIDSSFFVTFAPDDTRECVVFKDGEDIDGKDCTDEYFPICETACVTGG